MLYPIPDYIQFALETPERENHVGLQFRLQRGPADGTLDQTVGVRLRSEDLGVLAGVLEALVPAQV